MKCVLGKVGRQQLINAIGLVDEENDEMARRGRERMGRRESSDRDEGRGARGREPRGSSSRGRGRDRGDDDRGSRRGGGRGGSRFNYHERDPGAAKDRAEGRGDGGGYLKQGVNTWSPKKGDNLIRILPPTWPDAEHFGFDVYCHYSIGPENRSFLSLNKMKGEDDPIWDEYTEAQKQGDEDYAKELRPKRRVGYWIIDRDDERKGPQLWLAPYQSIDRELSKQIVDSRSGEVLLIDHPEEGYDVEFEKTGEKERTRYEGVRVARQSSELGRDADEWLEYIEENPIPDCLVYATYDEIANAFHARGASGGGRSDRSGRSDRGGDGGARGRGRSGGRGREEEEVSVTQADLDLMGFEELDDLIMEHRLDIDGQEFDSEEELAEEIAKELGIGRQESRGRGRDRDDDDDDRHDRMERGRGGRGRGRGRDRDADMPV